MQTPEKCTTDPPKLAPSVSRTLCSSVLVGGIFLLSLLQRPVHSNIYISIEPADSRNLRGKERRLELIQSSQIVSKSRSALLSPPQMLHRFRSLPAPPRLNPNPLGTSRLPFRRFGALSSPSEASPRSSRSAASLRRRIRSSSTASLSSSGASSIVSNDEIDGERDRADVGVEGMLLKLLLLA